MPHSEKHPLITVVIPTKDRAEYLRHTLRTCSIQDYDNLEVIVCDDGSRDHTRDIVESAARSDSRIRYTNPGGVGMRENFEFGLRQVKPGYVIALGGDDGLLPHGIRGMLEVLQETGQELLAWPTPTYTYPGVRDPPGQLSLYRRHRGSRVIRSQEFLDRQVQNLHYISDVESPMFYVKGVASTRLVDLVRSRSRDGRFYSCPTPDGYSGIVLAGEVQTFAFSGEPFSIFGVSPSSQGMNYLQAEEQAKRRSEAFFQDVSRMPMHQELASQPYSPLITLMTADYVLTIRDLPEWPGRFPPIDYRQLLVKSLNELAHGMYAEERVPRELRILDRIAEHHGLGDFFRSRVRHTRRFRKRSHFVGNGVNRTMLLLGCREYGIENVFDAAYVAHYAHRIVPRVTARAVAEGVVRSIAYRLRSLRRGGGFPPESEWRSNDAPGAAPGTPPPRSK